jgi:NaMN:DMB phosphoribosyltransferase
VVVVSDPLSRYRRRRALGDWGIVAVFGAALVAENDGVPMSWIALAGLAWYVAAVVWAAGKWWLRRRRTP